MFKAVRMLQTKTGDSPDPRVTTFIERSHQIIYGKDQELKLALACLLARGHLLIEDIPGMGKTTFVMCLSKLLGLKMNRIQFTNDLLPADILGTNIYDPKNSSFHFHPGPIFSEIVLGDELNRASPKSQSAFLQAMEERKITIDGKTFDLPKPFFIIATQNPQNQVGTYPLPESQLDRFMMRLSLGYPDNDSEKKILKDGDPRPKIESLPTVMTTSDLFEIQAAVEQLHVSDPLIQYVQELLTFSRSRGHGLSPRAGLILIQAAKGWAYIHGRKMVLPDDIQAVAQAVMNHRLNPQHMKVEDVIQSVAIP
jgi:MoxR-like ATPase